MYQSSHCSTVVLVAPPSVAESGKMIPEMHQYYFVYKTTKTTRNVFVVCGLKYRKAKRGSMFLPALVCLSVCMSVCDHDN